MPNLFKLYLTFSGNLSRIQYLGALALLIYLSLMMVGAGSILFAVIEANFLPALPAPTLEEFSTFSWGFLILLFIMSFPFICICTKRFNDMRLKQYRYIPDAFMLIFLFISFIFFGFVSGILLGIVILLCLMVPSRSL